MTTLGTKWVEIEDKELSKRIFEQTRLMEPYEEAVSLHVWEERFVVEQIPYRVFGNFTNDGYIVEELK